MGGAAGGQWGPGRPRELGGQWGRGRAGPHYPGAAPRPPSCSPGPRSGLRWPLSRGSSLDPPRRSSASAREPGSCPAGGWLIPIGLPCVHGASSGSASAAQSGVNPEPHNGTQPIRIHPCLPLGAPDPRAQSTQPQQPSPPPPPTIQPIQSQFRSNPVCGVPSPDSNSV